MKLTKLRTIFAGSLLCVAHGATCPPPIDPTGDWFVGLAFVSTLGFTAILFLLAPKKQNA